jgi:para-aminobenzoate synthetase
MGRLLVRAPFPLAHPLLLPRLEAFMSTPVLMPSPHICLFVPADANQRTRPSTTSIAFPSFIITYNLATRTIQLHHTANTPQKLQLRPGETFWDWFGEAQKSLSASLSTSTFTSFSPQHTPQEDQGQEAEGGSNGIEDDAAVDGGEGGFKGGWVGYFGYEMKAESLAGYSKGRYGVVQDDGGIERALNAERIDACWCWCDSVLERSKEGEWILRGILQAAGHADAAKLADSTSVDSDTLEETDTLPLAGNPLHTSEYPSPSNVDCRSPSRTNGHSNTSHMTSSSTDDNNSESSHPITATKRTQSSSTISLLQWLRDLNILPFITSAAYETLQQTLSLILSSPPSPRPSPSSPIPTFTPTCSPKSYKSLVETCRSAIHEGESYELTLTTSFESPLPDKVDPLDLYCGLRQRNPAYYSCFMHLNIDKQGEKGMYVLSSSPERFLKIDNTLSVCDSTVRKEANATNDRCQGQMMPGRRKGKRVVEMMPIKGTKRRVGYGECVCRVGRGCGGVRRHINYDASVNESHEAEGILRACEAEGRIEDWRRGEELRLDVKERAENLMVSHSIHFHLG